MDNKKRSRIVLEVLTNVFYEFPDTQGFINNNLTEICLREKVPVDQVFVLGLLNIIIFG